MKAGLPLSTCVLGLGGPGAHHQGEEGEAELTACRTQGCPLLEQPRYLFMILSGEPVNVTAACPHVL